ncbi:MAG: fumarylacetoacetate hydrolase family protein [Candidatus Bathyarchaeota archaeon]|jgi:2-keto-4-pentenoate hydratase/2-oxohepta-3-ene-1,7-dioic acid hydratase in catechol pathway
MKLLSFKKGDISGVGVLVDDKVLDIGEALSTGYGGFFSDPPIPDLKDMRSLLSLGEYGMREMNEVMEHARDEVQGGGAPEVLLSRDEVELMAPISRPSKNLVCLGLNYADHVAEGSKSKEEPRSLPKHPIFFTKPPTAVTGPYCDIVYPKVTEKLDYEVELAVVIGKRGKYIVEDDVYDHIAGYTAFNDVSARDLQRRHGQWFKGKSLDTFAPMGPYLVTPDEIGDPMNLDVWSKVDGEIRQSSNTSHMIFDIPTIIATLSAGITLEVGDVIATGTPSGVGSAHPLGFLEVGSVLETGIEKIGVMRNRVVAEQ